MQLGEHGESSRLWIVWRDIQIILSGSITGGVILTELGQLPQEFFQFCQVGFLRLRHSGLAARGADFHIILPGCIIKVLNGKVLDLPSQLFDSILLGIFGRGFCVTRGSLTLRTCILFVLIGRPRVLSVGLGIMVAVKLPIITAWPLECMVIWEWLMAGIAVIIYSGVQWTARRIVHMVCTHVILMIDCIL